MKFIIVFFIIIVITIKTNFSTFHFLINYWYLKNSNFNWYYFIDQNIYLDSKYSFINVVIVKIIAIFINYYYLQGQLLVKYLQGTVATIFIIVDLSQIDFNYFIVIIIVIIVYFITYFKFVIAFFKRFIIVLTFTFIGFVITVTTTIKFIFEECSISIIIMTAITVIIIKLVIIATIKATFAIIYFTESFIIGVTNVVNFSNFP